jgi:glycosyltransferase involved in cell wall biosynthesis
MDLLRYLRRVKPDVIHTHLTMATILGAVTGTLAGVPVVTSLHNTTMRTSQKRMLSSLETFALRYLVKHVVAVGWGTAEAHRARLGGVPIEVIPNAVSIPQPSAPETRQATRSTLLGDPTPSVLLYVGRLEPQKGLFDLLDAFSQVLEVHPGTRLLIAGSGAIESQVRVRVKDLGLEKGVKMLGQRGDIPDLLAASDIFVSAAHWEGLPVASLEAMAAGLPIVVTAVGDLPRVVQPGTGLLVSPGDPGGFAACINQLLAQPELREEMGVAARNHIRCHYNAANWADRLLDVYAGVIRSKGRGDDS